MKSKQQIEGDKTEAIIAKVFKEKGYWAYITPRKVNGQPVDIIAMKDGVNWLVDAKHLEENKKSFPFSRVEANQIDSLTYAQQNNGIKNTGFVIGQENDGFKLFFLPFDKLIELMKNDVKSVKISDLEDFLEVLENESKNKR